MPLPREHLLDELATAYVQTVAALAGATIAVSRRDYGVDGVVKDIAAGGKDGYFETGFPIEFQLKGTAVAGRASGLIKHDLRARNYNLIVSRSVNAIPYYLFLVCFDAVAAKLGCCGTAKAGDECGRLLVEGIRQEDGKRRFGQDRDFRAKSSHS
jgi:hypothetical protein